MTDSSGYRLVNVKITGFSSTFTHITVERSSLITRLFSTAWIVPVRPWPNM